MSQGLRFAALRDCDPAYRRFGSKRESALFELMSASTSYGHAAARGYVREVPIMNPCNAAKRILFDHRVGSDLQRLRHSKAEGLRCFEINHQLKLGWLYHG